MPKDAGDTAPPASTNGGSAMPGRTDDQDTTVTIESIGGKCPVQADGTINGWPFYFRARGEAWSLEIAEPGFDAADEAIWEHREHYSDERFAAGWMEVDEAIGFIDKAARLFVAWRQANPDADGRGRATALKLRADLTDVRHRLGNEARARQAAERRVVRLSRALGLDASRYSFASAQIDNGVEDAGG